MCMVVAVKLLKMKRERERERDRKRERDGGGRERKREGERVLSISLVPLTGFPSWALALVQCSDTFIITRGCSDTVTLPDVPVAAMTPAADGGSTSILEAIVGTVK